MSRPRWLQTALLQPHPAVQPASLQVLLRHLLGVFEVAAVCCCGCDLFKRLQLKPSLS
jgi:hypothetical protein